MTDYHFKKFLELVEPNIEFGNDVEPTKPDYSDSNNWAGLYCLTRACEKIK